MSGDHMLHPDDATAIWLGYRIGRAVSERRMAYYLSPVNHTVTSQLQASVIDSTFIQMCCATLWWKDAIRWFSCVSEVQFYQVDPNSLNIYCTLVHRLHLHIVYRILRLIRYINPFLVQTKISYSEMFSRQNIAKQLQWPFLHHLCAQIN